MKLTCCANAPLYLTFAERMSSTDRQAGWFMEGCPVKMVVCPFCGALLPLGVDEANGSLEKVRIRVQAERDGKTTMDFDQEYTRDEGTLNLRFSQTRNVDLEGAKFVCRGHALSLGVAVTYPEPQGA